MKRLLPILTLTAINGWAQCVMCFRTAEAQGAARAKLLNLGIVILGAPPFLMLAGFCWIIYRKNHVFAETETGRNEQRPADKQG